MLKETATVVSTSPGQAKVAIVRSEACGNCPSKSMCSTASGNINVLEVRNPVEAKPGQKVIVELGPAALVKAQQINHGGRFDQGSRAELDHNFLSWPGFNRVPDFKNIDIP